MPDRKSGLTFLQRSGLIPTHKNPEPRIEPRAIKVHSLELELPLPLPNLLYPEDGDYSPPDRGQTFDWPHPEEDE
jgi:hypothetical protein